MPKGRGDSLRSCFEYELSSVSLAVFNIDDSMNKGVKINILGQLKDKLSDIPHSLPDCLDFKAIAQMMCRSELSKADTIGCVCVII